MDIWSMVGLIFGILAGAGLVGTTFRILGNLKFDFLAGLPLFIKFALIDKITSYPEVISFINYYFYGFIIGGILLGIAKFFGVSF